MDNEKTILDSPKGTPMYFAKTCGDSIELHKVIYQGFKREVNQFDLDLNKIVLQFENGENKTIFVFVEENYYIDDLDSDECEYHTIGAYYIYLTTSFDKLQNYINSFWKPIQKKIDSFLVTKDDIENFGVVLNINDKNE